MKHKYLIFAFILTALALPACGSGRSGEATGEETDLNASLTNELSEIEALKGMDRKIAAYMQQWQIKGLSLAVMRGDSLLFAKGYGWADEARQEKMQPTTLLRLASISKLITAADIMVLCEQGKLSLRDTVFGERGILPEYGDVIKDKNYYKITVEDLLRHKGGFKVYSSDPLFSTRTVMSVNGLTSPPDGPTLVRCALKRNLAFVPGTSQAYSNLGYLILSLVIEKASGQSYEDFTQEHVLRKAGCNGFHIAGNYYKDRFPGEARYYVPVNEEPVPEFNNSGRMVTRCYGGNDIKALQGAGAWVASVPELMKFVAAIDGKPEIRDIISPESHAGMIEYFDAETYSLGWNDTKPDTGWTRSGTFSGTSALVKYFPDGECWILVTNTSTWKGPGLSRYHAGLFRALREGWGDKLPSRDLFHQD